MNTEPAVTYLMFRTLWAAIGMFLGLYALISVWKTRWGTINLSAKMMWWFQIALTPLSGLFWLWITMAFRGLVWPIGWVALMVMIVGSFLAPMNAFWLLVESRPMTMKPATSTA